MSALSAPQPLRILALGDSLTQGVGDPRPGREGFEGRLDGWVSHLVSALTNSGRPVELTNLAFAGAQTSHVVDIQLPRAAGRSADLATCFIGVNDLCRSSFDVARYRDAMEEVFGALCAASPLVLTATIHQFDARYPMPAHLRSKVRANIEAANEVLSDLAAQRQLLLLDFRDRPEMRAADIWAWDRLHPNRYGHQLIAADALQVLQAAGHFTEATLPAPKPESRGVPDLAHVVWVGGYVQRVLSSRLRARLG